MYSSVVINLGLVGLTCLFMFVYLAKFVFKYKSEYESNQLCTLTVLFSLFSVLLTTFILPVDIFLVSFIKEPDGHFKDWATNHTLTMIDEGVFITYYTLYIITALILFIVIPFLHFFNEASESNARDRLHSAIKVTSIFIIIIIVLLFLGAFLNTKITPNTIFDKFKPIKNLTRLQSSILMILTVIYMLGFVNVSFYTASGIFSWPIGLILSTSSVSTRYDEVTDQSDLFRVRVNDLREKARVDGLSVREREQLEKAEEDLRRLDREEVILSSYTSSWLFKVRRITWPIQITGIFFVLIALVLLTSLVIVNIDRILHSSGPKQGYSLIKPQIFNPLEYLCNKVQNFVFVGLMPLLLITSFLVIATISGIRNLGLWFLITRVQQVKVGRMRPQALLYFCMTMMFSAIAFNLTLYSLVPQYVTFGNQNYIMPGAQNGTHISRACSLEDYHSSCVLTRSSQIIMRIVSNLWIFGALFYWWGWAFVAVATVSLIAYIYRGRRQVALDILANNEDDFEE